MRAPLPRHTRSAENSNPRLRASRLRRAHVDGSAVGPRQEAGSGDSQLPDVDLSSGL